MGSLSLLPLVLLAPLGASPSPLSPAEALAAFQTAPGIRVELVAAEPLVIDPVAFAFDERGRLYVVEGRGYPNPGDKSVTHEGRVALLEDTDRDGRYDRRSEFAGGFTYPNGILVWRGGVFVTCAPDVVHLRDTDGDGVADVRQVVLTGLGTGASAQNYASHPTLGPDGHVYITCGLRSGGSVVSPRFPDRAAVNFQPADGRFHPDSFAYEVTGGRGQFGLAFDAFGRRFVCDNRNPVFQVMLEPWHLARNPALSFAQTMQEVSKVQAEARVFPISRSTVTADFIPNLITTPHAGTFTAACGIAVTQGSALPPDHHGNVFICEPAQNLVQRQTFRAAGASLRSDAVLPDRREFLATTDTWFRPVFLADGPGGGLYIADMYRAEIDHPLFIPEESRGKLDFAGGKNAGRIYRVTAAQATPPPLPAFGTREELLRAFESRDGWTRETARRLLIERADTAAAPGLVRLAAGSAIPEVRSAALWTLRSLGALQPPMIETATRDPDPRVREQAVNLAPQLMPHAPQLVERLVTMATDSDPRVRFLVALQLGGLAHAGVTDALAAIGARDADDRWARAAVLSGVGNRALDFTVAVIRHGAAQPSTALMVRDASRVVGVGESLENCRQLLAQAVSAAEEKPWRIAVALGLAEGLRGRRESKAGAPGQLAGLVASHPELARGLDGLFAYAARLAGDATGPIQLNAVALLGHGNFEQSGRALGDLLDARRAPELRLEAVRALQNLGDARSAALMLRPQLWSGYTPEIRSAVVAALSAKPALTELLFAAIEAQTIRAAEISQVQKNFLLRRAAPAVRQRAERVFESQTRDRMEVYRAHLDVLRVAGSAERGATVFTRVCAACHAKTGAATPLGPDLTGLRNQPAEALLLHILVPNHEIAPNHETVTVTTRDGVTFSGSISAETETSVLLRTITGGEETIPRSAIASLQRSGVSLMPDGLEQTMSRQELADLLAFLKQAAP